MKRKYLNTNSKLALLCSAVFLLLASTTAFGLHYDGKCRSCHTPHNALASEAPLWGKADVVQPPYTQYTSDTINATMGDPNGISKLCMICHSKTTSYGIGSDMRNDHPVSFTYDAALALADGRLWDPEVTLSNIGGAVGNGTIAQDMLRGVDHNQLECVSCHEPHDKYGFGKGSGLGDSLAYLVKANDAGQLCKTCHRK
ncbi:MAG: hypothetical protein A2X86_21440 [Bdellovibrionales bacterium GWA2_49_15]|nr:MAG: hypothetical protein A2X86_21440 [Bdellovibrionales bacterium GWA2_49_15]HAZ14944.1 cytochrome C [Bdellovibrionales bacterium]